jgi:hypothetical protein
LAVSFKTDVMEQYSVAVFDTRYIQTTVKYYHDYSEFICSAMKDSDIYCIVSLPESKMSYEQASYIKHSK